MGSWWRPPLPGAISRTVLAALLLVVGSSVPWSGERAQSAVVSPKPLEVFRDCAECPEMVALTGGTFVMGSDLTADTKPVHLVSVVPFAIGKYEVTWADWEPCMAAGVCREPDDHKWGRAKRPIINISWA